MAVDVATLIAESIDSYYAANDPAWTARVDEIVESWFAEARQLSETANPDRRGQSQDPEYRKGYKSGWKRAKDGGDATPPPADAHGRPHTKEYAEGFADGHGGSAHGQELLRLHASGDVGATANHAIQNIIAPHAKALAVSNKSNPDYQEELGNWLKGRGVAHTVGAVQMFNRTSEYPDTDNDGHHQPTAGKDGSKVYNDHPADMADFIGGKVGARAKYRAQDQAAQTAKDFQAAEKMGMGYDAQKSGSAQGMEALPSMMEYKEGLERLVYGDGAVKAHNERGGHAGIQEFRDRDHSQVAAGADPDGHDSHGEARLHAHDLWVKEILKKVQDAGQYADEEHALRGRTYAATVEHPDFPGHYHTPDENDRSLSFNPVQYVQDRMALGWGVRGAKSEALRGQLPNYKSGIVKKLDPARQIIGGKKHPHAASIDGLTKQLDGWMQENVPEFHAEHPMWEHHDGIHGLSGKVRGRKGRVAPRSAEAKAADLAARQARAPAKYTRRQAPPAKDVVSWVLDAVGDWLQEHVSLDASLVPSIKEDLFSRVQASYSHLFEVEYSG